MAYFRDDWHSRVRFELIDAGKIEDKKPYMDCDGHHFTHIYSYNKVMSFKDRKNIAKILNKTNFKLMTWYFSPKESAACGLKRFKLAYKMPMQSTGREKFTAYIYFKTEIYDEKNPWSEHITEDDYELASSSSEDNAINTHDNDQDDSDDDSSSES